MLLHNESPQFNSEVSPFFRVSYAGIISSFAVAS